MRPTPAPGDGGSNSSLASRSRKSSGADLSPGPHHSINMDGSTSTNSSGAGSNNTASSTASGASPSMVTYFLANESTMSSMSGSSGSSSAQPMGQQQQQQQQQPGPTSHPRRMSGTYVEPEDSITRRRRLSMKDREDTSSTITAESSFKQANPSSTLPITSFSCATSPILQSLRDEDMAAGEGLDSELSTDDEDVERSSNASFPLSITDTLPPGSPANPMYRNFSPGPPLPSHSLAGTRNASMKSLADSLPDTENPLLDFRDRTLRKHRPKTQLSLGEPLDSIAVESLDSSTLSTQFIMPTIKMPSRRPFTARGKELGRLRIMVVGDSGIGKTSLIKSIIQVNEDIVHVDPSISMTPNSSATSSQYGSKEGAMESTKNLTEVFGSTKPYPTWWSDFEDSRVLRRRKSMGETVLERNVCFVDTPGYGAGTSYSECIEPVVKYVERQLERTSMIMNGDEGDLLSFLTGNGSPQIDIVLYVILHRLKPIDIDFIRKLTKLTNVHPVIAKADTLTPTQTTELKLSILNDLRNAGIRAFLFGKSADDVARGLPGSPPFAISSAQAPDENMDASLLMSPDYVPPLAHSELDDLISHLFDAEHASWLRHSSTKKFLAWKSTHPGINPTIIPNPSPSASTQLIRARSPPYATNRSLVPVSGAGVAQSPSGTASSFVVARVADHTRREEHMAQLHLAKWAADLQRSIKAEKDGYERLAMGERAMWLTEKLGECVIDGTLVPTDQSGKMLVKTSSGETMAVEPIVRVGRPGSGFDRRDPMGWLKWNSRLRTGAYLLVQITGTAGVAGIIAVFVVKYVMGGAPAWASRLGL